MRSPHLSLSLSILLLPFLATALPQDPAPAPTNELTTTSTSTSTLTVTRTLVRGTAVVIATLPEISISDVAQATSITVPEIAVPTGSPEPSEIIIAPPGAFNSTLTFAPTATGKPIRSTNGPAPASFTGGAATTTSMGLGGVNVVMMGMAMALMGTLF